MVADSSDQQHCAGAANAGDNTAAHAVWDSSGKGLYFWYMNGDIYHVPADPENGFRQGTPELVFDTGLPQSFLVQIPGFAVSPDGQRFLYRDFSEGSTSFAAETDRLVSRASKRAMKMNPFG